MPGRVCSCTNIAIQKDLASQITLRSLDLGLNANLGMWYQESKITLAKSGCRADQDLLEHLFDTV